MGIKLVAPLRDLVLNEAPFPSQGDYLAFGRLLADFPDMAQDPYLYSPFEIAAALGLSALCDDFCREGGDPAQSGAAGFSPLALALIFKQRALFSSLASQKRATTLKEFRDIASLFLDDKLVGEMFPDLEGPLDQDYCWLLVSMLASREIADDLFSLASCADQADAMTWAFRLNPDLADHFWQNARAETKTTRNLKAYIAWVRSSDLTLPARLLEVFSQATAKEQSLLLFSLLYKKQEELFIKLYDHALPEAQSMRDKMGNTYLHFAIGQECHACVEHLAERENQVHAINHKGWSPLHYAQGPRTKRAPFFSTLSKRDGLFSHNLDRIRLLGHKFEMRGTLLESTLPHQWDFSLKEITSVFNRFGPQSYPESIVRSVETGLQTPYLTPKEQLQHALQERTLIVGGHESHWVYYIISKEFFVKIDTGLSKQPGIKFYHIGNFDQKIIASSLRHLLNDKKRSRTTHKEILNQIKEALSLELVASYFFNQHSANCNWQGSLIALLGLITLAYEEDSLDSPKERIEGAFNRAYPPFARLKESYLEEALDDLALIRQMELPLDEERVTHHIIDYCQKHQFNRPLAKLASN